MKDNITTIEEVRRIAQKYLPNPSDVLEPEGANGSRLITTVISPTRGKVFQFQLKGIVDLLADADAPQVYSWQVIDCLYTTIDHGHNLEANVTSEDGC